MLRDFFRGFGPKEWQKWFTSPSSSGSSGEEGAAVEVGKSHSLATLDIIGPSGFGCEFGALESAPISRTSNRRLHKPLGPPPPPTQIDANWLIFCD